MKRRIRKEILVAIWLLLIINFGLIAKIGNDILSVVYMSTLALLGYKIGKRYEVI